MTLKKALQNHIGERVKLGSASSFVYCGTVGDDIEAILNDMSDRELVRLKTSLQANIAHDLNFERFWEVRLKNKLKWAEEAAIYKKWTKGMKEDHIKKVREQVANLQTLPKRIKNFTKYMTRKVKDEYPSIDEGGTIIIFEGEERGLYWTYDEYERGLTSYEMYESIV